MKKYHPRIAKHMETVAPFDDKRVPPIQMADLIASIIKDGFLQYKQHGTAFPEKWNDHIISPIGIWDMAHTKDAVRATLKRKHKLINQPGPKATKIDIKAQRRMAIEKEKNKRGL